MPTIDNFTTAVDANGMQLYLDELKASLITKTEEIIDDVSEISSTITNGWQGHAKDKFWEDFLKARTTVKDDLKLEYQNLIYRLRELLNEYYETDRKMMND